MLSVAIIVAAANNGVIGRDGAIPWHLSSDLKRFKALTLGHTIIMGRLTFQSIGKPLPGRRTIVVTGETIDGVETVGSLDAALAIAKRPVFLVGGAKIYAEGMTHADTIYLTRVDAAPEGDTVFPPIDETVFAPVAEDQGIRGPRDDHDFTYVTYARR